MQSKATFDLDASNNPVVKLQITSTSDVRDKIARRFIETLGNASIWCLIYATNESEYTIFPLTPGELRDQANVMIAKADELDKVQKVYPFLPEKNSI